MYDCDVCNDTGSVTTPDGNGGEETRACEACN